MPTVFSHPAPIFCLGLACGGRLISWRLLLAGAFCSVLPDLDVISFTFGVPYANALGHRGMSHSLLFAASTGLLAALAAPFLRSGRLAAFLVCAAGTLSHVALDALTNGGLGVALLWPFSDARFFSPWRPIAVSPLSLRRFFSAQGMHVLKSEALWIWLPSLVCTGLILPLRLKKQKATGSVVFTGKPELCRKKR